MKLLRWLFAAVTIAMLANAFRVAMFVVPADKEQGNIFRIFFYHFPSAMMTFLFFFVSFIASIVYLASHRSNPLRALKADALALSSAEMGVVFCTVVLITGPLWARPVWGIWWTWDERLTSTLVLYLIYVAYLLLRRFAAGPQMRTLAAVMAIFGYVDVPIVYMSTRWWRTQHPAPVFGGGPDSGIDPSMMPAVWWNLAAWLAWGILIVSWRYAVEYRLQSAEQQASLDALEVSR
jgi:heme exporter protein C